MLSLQIPKTTEKTESAQEQIIKLHVKAVECDYKENDRSLTEQFIHGLDDDGMIGERSINITGHW